MVDRYGRRVRAILEKNISGCAIVARTTDQANVNLLRRWHLLAWRGGQHRQTARPVVGSTWDVGIHAGVDSPSRISQSGMLCRQFRAAFELAALREPVCETIKSHCPAEYSTPQPHRRKRGLRLGQHVRAVPLALHRLP